MRDGVLFCGNQRHGFPEEAQELQPGKPGEAPRPSGQSRKEDLLMIMLLADLLLVGKFTVIIVWRRKGQR